MGSLDAVHEFEEMLPLLDILSQLEEPLNDGQLVAILTEACDNLRLLPKNSVFQCVCITPEDLCLDSGGNVRFSDRCSDREPDTLYVPPEYEACGNSFLGHVYSLGMTILFASEYNMEFRPFKRNEQLTSLLSRMTSESVVDRCSLDSVLMTTRRLAVSCGLDGAQKVCYELYWAARSANASSVAVVDTVQCGVDEESPRRISAFQAVWANRTRKEDVGSYPSAFLSTATRFKPIIIQTAESPAIQSDHKDQLAKKLERLQQQIRIEKSFNVGDVELDVSPPTQKAVKSSSAAQELEPASAHLSPLPQSSPSAPPPPPPPPPPAPPPLSEIQSQQPPPEVLTRSTRPVAQKNRVFQLQYCPTTNSYRLLPSTEPSAAEKPPVDDLRSCEKAPTRKPTTTTVDPLRIRVDKSSAKHKIAPYRRRKTQAHDQQQLVLSNGEGSSSDEAGELDRLKDDACSPSSGKDSGVVTMYNESGTTIGTGDDQLLVDIGRLLSAELACVDTSQTDKVHMQMAKFIFSLSNVAIRKPVEFAWHVRRHYADFYWTDELLEQLRQLLVGSRSLSDGPAAVADKPVRSAQPSVVDTDLNETNLTRSVLERRDRSSRLSIALHQASDLEGWTTSLVREVHRVAANLPRRPELLERKIQEFSDAILLELRIRQKTASLYKAVMDSLPTSKNPAEQRDVIGKIRAEFIDSQNKLTLLYNTWKHFQLQLASSSGLAMKELHRLVEVGDKRTVSGHDRDMETVLDAKFVGADGPAGLYSSSTRGLLCILFSSESYESGYVLQFLHSYRYAITPHQLFEFFSRVISNGSDSATTKLASDRALDLLFVWLHHYYSVDFGGDEFLLATVRRFITQQFPAKHAGVAVEFSVLLANLQKPELIVSGKSQEQSLEEILFENVLPSSSRNGNHWSSMLSVSRPKERSSSKFSGLGPGASAEGCFWRLRGTPCVSSLADGTDEPLISSTVRSPQASITGEEETAFSLSQWSAKAIAEQLMAITEGFQAVIHPVQLLDSRSHGVHVLWDSELVLTINDPTSNSASADGRQCSTAFRQQQRTLFKKPSPRPKQLADWLQFCKKLSHWVAAELLTSSSGRSQLAALVKFITVAEMAGQLRDFCSLVGIFSALQSVLVRQLPAWKYVPQKYANTLETLSNMVYDLRHDAQFYVHALNEADLRRDQSTTHLDLSRFRPIVCDPASLLWHVHAVEDGPFTTANGQYNWRKLRSLSDYVDQLRLCQQVCRLGTIERNRTLADQMTAQMDELFERELRTLAAANSHVNHPAFARIAIDLESSGRTRPAHRRAGSQGLVRRLKSFFK